MEFNGIGSASRYNFIVRKPQKITLIDTNYSHMNLLDDYFSTFTYVVHITYILIKFYTQVLIYLQSSNLIELEEKRIREVSSA